MAAMKTFMVEIKAFGHESVLKIEARSPAEARRKAMAARGVTITVTERA